MGNGNDSLVLHLSTCVIQISLELGVCTLRRVEQVELEVRLAIERHNSGLRVVQAVRVSGVAYNQLPVQVMPVLSPLLHKEVPNGLGVPAVGDALPDNTPHAIQLGAGEQWV